MAAALTHVNSREGNGNCESHFEVKSFLLWTMVKGANRQRAGKEYKTKILGISTAAVTVAVLVGIR